MHSAILTLFCLLVISAAIKFDKVKLMAALEKGDKDPEQIPCWNGSRWGSPVTTTFRILESPVIVECWSCPCKLVVKRDSNLNICEKCDLEKTRVLARNYEESKFTAEQIALCGADTKCAHKGFFPKECTKCPNIFTVQNLAKFMGLLAWLEDLKE